MQDYHHYIYNVQFIKNELTSANFVLKIGFSVVAVKLLSSKLVVGVAKSVRVAKATLIFKEVQLRF